MAKKKTKKAGLQLNTLRVARTGFAYVGVFLLATIIFDSWNLLPKELVGKRWIAASLLLVVTAAVWYFARRKSSAQFYTFLVFTLAIAQIAFASFNVYWERGMASTLPILFVIPILTAAALKKRVALLTVTTLSAAAYSASAVLYFFENYGEGYRVQLWGQVFFVSGILFVISWLLMVAIGLRHDSE
jgi:hypothetical protein